MTCPNARSLLYRYLLGEATDEAKREVEERSLVDEDYGEMLRETEPDLMAAYVSRHLTLDKRERFEKHFLNSEERLKKLALAAALYERAEAGPARFRNPDDHLRRYLLGELSPDEEVKVEERLLTDDGYKKRLETAEQGLIADYVREDLTEAEREMFEKHFLRFDGREEKLRWTQARGGSTCSGDGWPNLSASRQGIGASPDRFGNLWRPFRPSAWSCSPGRHSSTKPPSPEVLTTYMRHTRRNARLRLGSPASVMRNI